MKAQLNTDEQLVNSFFSKYQKQEIPDNGFSTRVMERIEAASVEKPARSVVRTIVWRNFPTVLCAAACTVLFIFADGFTILRTALQSTFANVVGSIAPLFSPLSAPHSPLLTFLYIYIAVITLIIVAAYNIILIERHHPA